MTLLRVLTVVFMIVCLIITVVILLQEGKQARMLVQSVVQPTHIGERTRACSMEGKLE